jgi:hypothetical protein
MIARAIIVFLFFFKSITTEPKNWKYPCVRPGSIQKQNHSFENTTESLNALKITLLYLKYTHMTAAPDLSISQYMLFHSKSIMNLPDKFPVSIYNFFK